jgi:hypothetical protein
MQFRKEWREKMRKKYQRNEVFRRVKSGKVSENFRRKYQTDIEFRRSWRMKMNCEMRLKYINRKLMNMRNIQMRLKYVSQAVFRIHCINRIRGVFECDPLFAVGIDRLRYGDKLRIRWF